jgi:hypothetical protein
MLRLLHVGESVLDRSGLDCSMSGNRIWTAHARTAPCWWQSVGEERAVAVAAVELGFGGCLEGR